MYKVLATLKNCFSPKDITFYCFSNAKILNSYTKSNFSTVVNKTDKWDLLSAVSLERKPIITKELNEIENKFLNLLKETEYERSFKSNHEIRHEVEKIKAEQLKKGNSMDVDSEIVVQQTAQDIEDAYKDELKAYTFSERLTEADVKNDVKSVHRQLDQSLLFLIQQKIGKNLYWILPQGINKEGESMRQTAERVLQEFCGDSLKAKFLGNAPCGFYKYKYPQSVLKDGSSVGAKIFFFKAQLLDGTPNFPKNGLAADYQWATRNDLTVLQSEYRKSVSLFLVDVEN